MLEAFGYMVIGIVPFVVGFLLCGGMKNNKLEQIDRVCRRAGTSLDDLLRDAVALEWAIQQAIQVGMMRPRPEERDDHS